MGKKNQPINPPPALSPNAEKTKAKVQKRATSNQRMAFGKAKIKPGNLFTTADVMKLFDISESSAKRWRKNRELPYFKMGGTIYYFKDVIFKMLKDRTVFPDLPEDKT